MNLFPKRKPYRQGYFSVTDGHQLHYALYGNPKGIPVLYVHGGPGLGTTEFDSRHFNPRKFNIILIDQRGSGKSKPFAGLKGNNTKNLVEDFYKFLKFLKIKKTFLFGGSWGSTLSLCYAIKHPETVLGMVLRGIYLGGGFRDDYMLNGGPKTHFPEEWERFIGNVPKGKNHLNYYWKMMNSKNKKTAIRYIREWSFYEESVLRLNPDPKKSRNAVMSHSIIPLAKLEAHYFKNNCFLPKNYIFNNTSKMRKIPLSIIHGRYDFVTTPEHAYFLHKMLPKSKLQFTIAGHSGSDGKNREMMVNQIHEIAKKTKAKNCYF